MGTCLETGLACSTAYRKAGCRCHLCLAWKRATRPGRVPLPVVQAAPKPPAPAPPGEAPPRPPERESRSGAMPWQEVVKGLVRMHPVAPKTPVPPPRPVPSATAPEAPIRQSRPCPGCGAPWAGEGLCPRCTGRLAGLRTPNKAACHIAATLGRGGFQGCTARYKGLGHWLPCPRPVRRGCLASGAMGLKLGKINWPPAPGRPVVCRRPGCRKPAVVETLALCEAHLTGHRPELERWKLEHPQAVARPSESGPIGEAPQKVTHGRHRGEQANLDQLEGPNGGPNRHR